MSAYQWFAEHGLTLNLRQMDIDSVPQSGPSDEAIAWLRRDSWIKGQLDSFPVAAVAAHLKEYGAWEPEQLADHDENLSRTLWLAIGDVKENPADYTV